MGNLLADLFGNIRGWFGRLPGAGKFTFSAYDKLFVGLFLVFIVVGLWFGKSGWGARHVGGGVAYAAGYDLGRQISAYKPISPYGPGTAAVAAQIAGGQVQGIEAGYPQNKGQVYTASDGKKYRYQNVQVLKNLSYNQFGAIMANQMSGALGVGLQLLPCGQQFRLRYGQQEDRSEHAADEPLHQLHDHLGQRGQPPAGGLLPDLPPGQHQAGGHRERSHHRQLPDQPRIHRGIQPADRRERQLHHPYQAAAADHGQDGHQPRRRLHLLPQLPQLLQLRGADQGHTPSAC